MKGGGDTGILEISNVFKKKKVTPHVCISLSFKNLVNLYGTSGPNTLMTITMLG